MRPDDPLKALIPELERALERNGRLTEAAIDHFNAFTRKYTAPLALLAISEGVLGMIIAAWAVFINPDDLTGETGILTGVLVVGGAITGWVAYGGPGGGDKTPKGQYIPPVQTADDDDEESEDG